MSKQNGKSMRLWAVKDDDGVKVYQHPTEPLLYYAQLQVQDGHGNVLQLISEFCVEAARHIKGLVDQEVCEIAVSVKGAK